MTKYVLKGYIQKIVVPFFLQEFHEIHNVNKINTLPSSIWKPFFCFPHIYCGSGWQTLTYKCRQV